MMNRDEYPRYTTTHLQTTNDIAHLLTSQTGPSQYATQQARPRPILRHPTFFLIGCKTQGDRVYAVTLVGWRSVTFPLEHMAKVPPTSSAGDLRALHAQRHVDVAGHSARDGVKEGWPAAAAVELCATLVKRRLASRARIDPGRLVVLVLARPSSLGALHPEHLELLGTEDRPPFLLGFGLANVRHLSNDRC